MVREHVSTKGTLAREHVRHAIQQTLSKQLFNRLTVLLTISDHLFRFLIGYILLREFDTSSKKEMKFKEHSSFLDNPKKVYVNIK